MRLIQRVHVDPYICALLAMVLLASVLPVRGIAAARAGDATTGAIGLLFFLYGARLSPRQALDGLRNWRLHAFVLGCTFLVFPALGMTVRTLMPGLFDPTLYTGVVFLCTLPSTVQSSIAFTSIGRGNVAAAICSASFSNLLGIFVTPLLVAFLLSTSAGGFSTGSMESILLELLAPFIAGQLARPLIAGWVARHRQVLGYLDRGSILLVVYTAFSKGVVAGIWHQVSFGSLVALFALCLALLSAVLFVTSNGARLLGFPREDHIAIVFCGSKKSLASGLPMAAVLFSGRDVALIVLPLMLFHMIQLMWCAELARRYARWSPAAATPEFATEMG